MINYKDLSKKQKEYLHAHLKILDAVHGLSFNEILDIKQFADQENYTEFSVETLKTVLTKEGKEYLKFLESEMNK